MITSVQNIFLPKKLLANRRVGENVSNMTVLYIVSSGHSGSTAFGSALGMNPGFEMLGEVSRILRVREKKICTCGESFQACPVWKRVLAQYDSYIAANNYPKSSVLTNNSLVFNAIQEVLPDAQYLIDSSKGIKRLETLVASGFTVKPIWLVRNGFEVAVSAKSSKIRQRAVDPLPLEKELETWGAQQAQIRRRLLALGTEFLRIRYEDWLSGGVNVERDLERFLSVKNLKITGEVKTFDQHHVDGNRLRKEKSFKIAAPTSNPEREIELASLKRAKCNYRTRRELKRHGYLER